ncbi:MAG: aminopeptidase P family protein [Lachnospira sp.]|nr:aminopeptidase P family protein [Lachnospira sp.]
MIKERLEAIRKLMAKENISAYIIPTSDYHQSEYISEYFKCREYMSGFTGSAGTLVIGINEAALYTDGRYFIQATKELLGSGITLMKIGEEGVMDLLEYVENLLKDGGCLGFDAKYIDANFGIEVAKKIDIKSIDLVSPIWNDRPAMPYSKAFVLEEKYAGESVTSKLVKIREEMRKVDAKYHLVTSLCDIAWIYNIRANDVLHNPVLLAYTLITDDAAYLYTDESKLDFTIDGVTIRPYESIYEDVKKLSGKVMADIDSINYELYLGIDDLEARHNPSTILKAVKNETEIKNLYKAHIKDGVAVTKFIYWLKKNVKSDITEKMAAEHLENLRKEQKGYIEPSFETISAYGANAALMHYSIKDEVVLKNEGFLLVDSGGQYYEGTTDVTRTIALGVLNERMKECYTLVLKGMLSLSDAKFLYGCTGRNLDILARGPLWQNAIDYKCGTGHGVGYLLNVHEGPNGFRYKKPKDEYYDCVIEEGMVSSNEPGVYFEDEFGIRIENEIIAKKHIKNEYGQFMAFETLTLVPFDLDAIDYSLLSKKEIDMINKYHKRVYDELSPFLLEEEKEWLLAMVDGEQGKWMNVL